MAQRIPNTTLSGNFADGEILRGWQLNKVVEVLKAGVNLNKSDIDKILLGGESDFVFATKALADAYLSENDAPNVNQYALVMAGGLDGTTIDIYKYVGGVWELQVDEVFSIFYAYTTARDIDDRVSQLELDVPALQTAIEDGNIVHDKVAYNTIVPASTLSIGETRWNAEVETLETRVSNDVYLQHGQELDFKCKNTSGVDIANGTPVYITGASGSSPNFYIAKASSSDYVQTLRCIGLATENIDNGAWGKVCVIGIVNGLNTNTFEVGDVVYLGAGGIITTVRPTTNVLALGVVIQKSTTQGRIALRPIFFPRPEDLSTVHYSGLANGDILVKDATGWTNYALTNKANVADLTAGTITVKKAEQDKDGNAIDTTYVKVSGVNAMTDNLNLGTHKITNLADGVADQDGATIKNIDTKITAHDGSGTAHTYIRQLIEALEQEIERLDGRGKSYGEIAYTTAELLALNTATRDVTITNAVKLGHGGTGYTPSNGDLVYDTGVGDGVSYHEWEFNGIHWVDNGLIGYSKASNTIYGMIKGDGTYLSVVSGLVQVLKSDYATNIGASGASYNYSQLVSAFSDRYTKAEVDALIDALIDALKTAFGWEETNLGTYSAPVDLSSYDLVLLQLIATDTDNYVYTQMIKPADYATDDIVSLIARESADDSVAGAGVIIKGATTWSYQQVTSTPILKMRGYKIKPILAENVEVAFTGTTYLNSADDVKEALVELDDNLHDAWVEIGAIEDGTVAVAVADKATNDGNDNQIDLTYETKADASLKNAEQDLRLSTIEENLRKSMSGEVTGTANGTAIVSLGKDVANAPLKVEVDGGIIPALTNLVTNGDTFASGFILHKATGSVTNNIYTFLATAQNGRCYSYINTPIDNVIISYARFKTDSNLVYLMGSYGSVPHSGSNLYEIKKYTFKAGATTDPLQIRDTRTSGWNNIDIDYFMSFNLTASHGVTATSGTAYDNAVADIEAMLALKGGYILSTPIHAVSMNKRVRSVGKNLCPTSPFAWEQGTLSPTTGLPTTSTVLLRTKDFIPKKVLTAYISSVASGYAVNNIWLYDGNQNFIVRTNAVTIPNTSNSVYCKLVIEKSPSATIIPTDVLNANVQLELGSTATTYEPYVSSDLFLQANANGYRLPNGVKDTIEYRNGKYYYVKRLNTATVVGVVAVNTTNYPSAKNTGQFVNYLTAGGNETGVIGTNSTSGNGLLVYELATPIETEIFTFGNLNGYPNGTVYIDDVMQDADIYTTNATITNTDYPIKTLEKIVKINSDGSQTDLAVSGATVASGGLSFTHSSLTSGDMVWFSYVYDVANLFKSTSIITFYDNKFVIADTANGKIYKWAVTSTNGVASIALTEV